MAHYTTSKRMLKAYKDCRGYYGGFGPVECMPQRLRFVRSIKPRKHISAFQVLLVVVKSKRIPKAKRAYNKWASR